MAQVKQDPQSMNSREIYAEIMDDERNRRLVHPFRTSLLVSRLAVLSRTTPEQAFIQLNAAVKSELGRSMTERAQIEVLSE